MRKKTRRIARLLALALLLAALTLPVLAGAEGQEAYFYLAAWTKNGLIFTPERVEYTQGQTIEQALAASGHRFTGLEAGNVTEIDGQSGQFLRSDENGGYALDAPALGVRFFCFGEGTAQPSAGRQSLIRAMAELSREADDVRAAARTELEAARDGFVAASDTKAATLAENITQAVQNYKNTLAGERFSVRFTDGSAAYSRENYAAVSIEAENAFGRVYTDEDGDGALSLPAGSYRFTIAQSGKSVSGALTVTENETLTAKLPEGEWLVRETLAVSEGYGEAFDEGAFSGSYDGQTRTLTLRVPDAFAGQLYVYADTAEGLSGVTLMAEYTRTDGQKAETPLALASKNAPLSGVLARGSAGNSVTLRLSREEGGLVYAETHTLLLRRTLSLSALRLTDGEGAALALDTKFDPETTEYTCAVLDSVTQVTLYPAALSGAEGYLVTVNGQTAGASGVTLALTQDTNAQIVVSANGEQTTYTVRFRRAEGKTVTFNTTAADITLVVRNENGEELPYQKIRQANGYNAYLYKLVAGGEYEYVATKGTYYHAAKRFKVDELANSTVSVSVTTENWLEALSLGNGPNASAKGAYPLSFQTAEHAYTVEIPDTRAAVYLWANWSGSTKTAEARYACLSAKSEDGTQKSLSLAKNKATGTLMTGLLMTNAQENTLTLRLSQKNSSDGVTYYQDYSIRFVRTLSLQTLSLRADSQTLTLQNDALESASFAPEKTAYTVTVPAAATTLEVTASARDDAASRRYGQTDTGYSVFVNGGAMTGARAEVSLSGTAKEESLTLTVTNRYAPERMTKYTIRVLKTAPILLHAEIAPEGSLLALYEDLSGKRVWPENGVYTLSDGFSYSYLLTKNGYVGRSGRICVSGAGEVTVDGAALTVSLNSDGARETTLRAELAKAPENPALEAVDAQWADFRGTSFSSDGTPGAGAYSNNAVTAAKIPVSAESGTLLWASALGSGVDSGAAGSPILVDGYLITYAGDTLYRLDTVSGETVATGKMDHKSSFAITPPSYYDGMIFVALSDGTVQAFDAKTLCSLWIYRDPLGGQPNSPITVYDGYLYTGFWNSESQDANYVCLPVADEDPTREKEEKTAAWRYTHTGGFYWAGAYVCEEYLLVGTDDGQSGYSAQTSSLLMLDRMTGAVLDRRDGLNADIRSTVCYDAETDAFYFTSKGGSFYRAKTEKTEDGWRITALDSLALSNGTKATAMSTSTPVVYDGRAYLGVSGASQFTAYSGHNITVIDLESWEIAYSVPTRGYPQTSGLLTSGYDDCVYVFFFENSDCGTLRLLRDRKGQTKAEYLTQENGVSAAYALFTPSDRQAQYAICSPIVDEYGTIYFKNDSGYVMAFGSTVTELKVSTPPDKTEYQEGECFDPAGMTVTATLANGLTRDVTAYVTYKTGTLSQTDTGVTLRFPYALYHNQEAGSGMTAGVVSTTKYTTVSIRVSAARAATAITQVRVSGNTVTAVFDGTPEESWKLYAASFDKAGRLIAVSAAEASAAATQTLTLSGAESAATVRVFVLDAQSAAPRMAAGVWTRPET